VSFVGPCGFQSPHGTRAPVSSPGARRRGRPGAILAFFAWRYSRVLAHSLQVILLLALVVASAKAAGALANRIHQPSVFGEIVAGLLLGPTVLNVLAWPLFASPEGAAGVPLIDVVRDLAQIGVLLLMFVAGLETDLVMMRHVGKVAFWSAFGGVVLPMIVGTMTAVAFGLPLYWEGIFIGAILTATSVSISAQTLMELGALRSREGATILGAAVIDDVMGIIVLSFVVAFAKSSGGGADVGAVGLAVVRMAAYFAVAVAAGRLLRPVLRWAGRLPVTQAVLSASVVARSCSWCSHAATKRWISWTSATAAGRLR